MQRTRSSRGSTLITRTSILIAALALLIGPTACLDSGSGAPGARLEIQVAPLDLPSVTNVCYGIEVTNGLGEEVWSRAGVCADRFGDGAGDVSYIGACDASPSAALHSVALTLESVYDSAGLIDPASYQNPGTLTRSVTCVADSDVPVTFDLTIMRRAQQGFFDVAVTFNDLFCSAKVDCLDTAGQPLHLLFDEQGARNTTAVMGLACTEGIGGSGTHLYRTAVTVDCPGIADDVTLNPSAGPGNAYPTATTDPIYQYGVFQGEEALSSGGQAISKIYWNIALGLDLDQLPAGCRLVGSATASSGPLLGSQTPAGSAYPVIDYNVSLTDVAGLACTTHPLNGPGSGVATRYAAPDSPETFAYHYSSAPSLPDGSSALQAARHCAQLHADYPALPDGDYWIDPDGDGGDSPFLATCDMTTDGGGWTNHYATATRTFTGASGFTDGGASASYFDGDWQMAFGLNVDEWNHNEGAGSWIQSDILSYQDVSTYSLTYGIQFGYFEDAPYSYIKETFQIFYRDTAGTIARANFYFPSFLRDTSYQIRVLFHNGTPKLFVDGAEIALTHLENGAMFGDNIHAPATLLRLGNLYDSAKNLRQFRGGFIQDFRVFYLGAVATPLFGAGIPSDPYYLDPRLDSCKAYADILTNPQDGSYAIDAAGDGQAPYRAAYCDFTDRWEIHEEAVNLNLAGTRTFCKDRGLELAVPTSSEADALATVLLSVHDMEAVRLDMDVRLTGGCNSAIEGRSNAGAYRSVAPFTLPGKSQCSSTTTSFILGAQVIMRDGGYYSAVGSGNQGGTDHTGWTNFCVHADSSSCTSFAADSEGPFPVCSW